RALNLNEDLAEAIALGHDLGHTPFGHVGEEVLNELYAYRFKHNEQSLRVVDLLENDGQGLNLTWEVRDGIVNHSKSRVNMLEDWGKVGTLEGEVCRIADIVAYINHDIGDAIRGGIITEDDLPTSATIVLGHSHRERVNTLVCDIIEQSWAVRGDRSISDPAITMSRRVLEATNALREFLFDKVYNVHAVQEEAEKARGIIRLLYKYFNGHENKLPPEYSLHSDEVERRVVDYIAGMTDQYALRLAEELSLTR
ncbi:HD domain-containing protein, partial [Chloroflexota bacterium]